MSQGDDPLFSTKGRHSTRMRPTCPKISDDAHAMAKCETWLRGETSCYHHPVPIYTSSVPPPRTYPCGACGKIIPRAMALRQAGYCEMCEYMTTAEALALLMVGGNTLSRMYARGELRCARVGRKRLWPRADVVGAYERMRLAGKGWAGLAFG
jgi:excisionase family DNA binding protein